MEKKQIIGILAAAVAFVFICGSSILINNYSGKGQVEKNSLKNLMSSLEDLPLDLPLSPYVGVVSIEGVIMPSSSTTSLFPTEGYNHQSTLNLVKQFQNSEQNRGILLNINTPGGAVFETDELYQLLMEYKEQTGRPVWTYMGSQACSGGYYIAMASDKIIANRNTWTGSIGVIVSLSNYKELMDKIGIETILYTSGKNKAMGNPGIDVSEEQAAIFQSLVDEAYEQFAGIVAEGRGMSIDVVKPLADGRIYTAQQALKLNLIDGIGGYEEAKEQMSELLDNDVTFYTPQKSAISFGSIFSLAKSFTNSDAEKIKELLEIKESGVPMYYAAIGE